MSPVEVIRTIAWSRLVTVLVNRLIWTMRLRLIVATRRTCTVVIMSRRAIWRRLRVLRRVVFSRLVRLLLAALSAKVSLVRMVEARRRLCFRRPLYVNGLVIPICALGIRVIGTMLMAT